MVLSFPYPLETLEKEMFYLTAEIGLGYFEQLEMPHEETIKWVAMLNKRNKEIKKLTGTEKDKK